MPGVQDQMKLHLKNKKDGNHKQVVTDLRAQGVEVVETMEPVDTLCYHSNGNWGWVELKSSRQTEVTRKQLTFVANTRMPVTFAQDADTVLRFLKTGVGLSQTQKDLLAGFLVRNQGDKWTYAAIERVMSM